MLHMSIDVLVSIVAVLNIPIWKFKFRLRSTIDKAHGSNLAMLSDEFRVGRNCIFKLNN